jgi:hypothetical protein
MSDIKIHRKLRLNRTMKVGGLITVVWWAIHSFPRLKTIELFNMQNFLSVVMGHFASSDDECPHQYVRGHVLDM